MDSSFSPVKKLGYVIRFYRRVHNLSQVEMAQRLGISERNFQRLELGQVEPRLDTLQKISTLLNIPVSTLLRPTEMSLFSMCDLSTHQEIEKCVGLKELNEQSLANLTWVHELLNPSADHEMAPRCPLHAKINGTKMHLSSELQAITGLNGDPHEMDDYLVYGSSVERWEVAFRKKLQKALIVNHFLFPQGYKVFEEYHYEINPEPDSLSSKCYVRDITANHSLEHWIKVEQTKSKSLTSFSN